MSKTTKIILGIVVVVIIVVLVAVFYKPAEKGTIKIGAIGVLTGDAASYGRDEKNAVEMAVQEINSQGGVNGQKIEIIYEDGKCNGKDALTAAQKLINIDKVKIILGGCCSGETLAIAPLVEQNKVILFSSYSGSPDITNAGDFVFRNAPSDAQGGKDAAEMVFNDGYKKSAILTENTDYPQAVRKIFKEQFTELEGEIVADEIYSTESKDYRTQLIKIKAANPDAIFFMPQSGSSGGLAAKQAKELGINVSYYGHVLFSGEDALNNGKEALNGLKFTDAPGLSKDNPKAVLFLEQYTAKYSNLTWEYGAGARYDSVYILRDAIKFCRRINTECIRDFLYRLKDYDGVIGKYGFDKNGDVVGIKFIIKKIIDAEKGEIIEIK